MRYMRDEVVQIIREIYVEKKMDLFVQGCHRKLSFLDNLIRRIGEMTDKSTVFFNVFFMVGNSVMGYGKLGVADDLVLRVFDLGKDILREIADLYVENDQKPPHQYRFIYGNGTHSFDADYNFDDLEKSKKGPYEVFTAWKDKIAKKMSK